jgi:hypothetical protein
MVDLIRFYLIERSFYETMVKTARGRRTWWRTRPTLTLDLKLVKLVMVSGMRDRNTLLEIRVLQWFFTNTYNKPLP